MFGGVDRKQELQKYVSNYFTAGSIALHSTDPAVKSRNKEDAREHLRKIMQSRRNAYPGNFDEDFDLFWQDLETIKLPTKIKDY